MTSNLDAALTYVDRGWHVFPCRGKRPAIRGGCHSASADPATVRRWWTARPDATVGVACGPSELVVVDLDRKPDADGLAALADVVDWDTPGDDTAAARVGDLWATRIHSTPSGGVHLLFAADPGRVVRNAVGLWPGVDVRAAGGYVIAPPSPGYATSIDRDPAPVPPWLVDALTARTPVDAGDQAVTVGRDPFAALLASLDSGDPGAYAHAALEGLVGDVAAAGEGSRNHTTNAAAFRAGRFVGAGVLDAVTAADALVGAAVAAGLPRGEALTAVRSGLAAGARRPWQPKGERA